MSEFGDGVWKSQIRQDKINRYKPASLRFLTKKTIYLIFFSKIIFAKLKTFDIKRSTGPRPTARLLEPVDDDIFNVWFDHENQVVRMGRRFLFHHFVR